jgi:hypothetical protein
MPTITKVQASFGGYRYQRTVKFSLKSRKFIADLPRECTKVLGYWEISAESMKELESRFMQASNDYCSKTAERRKVIVYRIEPHLVEDNTPLDPECSNGADGVGLSVFAAVMNELTYESERRHKSYEEVDSSIPVALSHSWSRLDELHDGYLVIDWTEEREEFFRKLGVALIELVKRCHEEFGERDKLMKSIDRGLRLLPAPKGEW